MRHWLPFFLVLWAASALANVPQPRDFSKNNANLEATQFGYDAAGDLTTLIDGLNHSTTWHYNQFGWPTNKVDALNREIVRYSYDSNGRLTNRWMLGSGNTGYTYDNVGNLKSILYPQSSILYSYDALNRLTNMVDAVGTTVFSYTPAGQLASEDGPWAADTVTSSYTQQLRTALTLAQPGTNWSQSYGYDSAWRLTSLSSPAGDFLYGYKVGQASSLPVLLALPNGTYITNHYDSLARLDYTALVNHWGHVLDGYSYQMDLLGLRTNITRDFGLTTNLVAAAYDNIGQLICWNATETNGRPRLNEQYGWAYDAAHNLQFRTNNLLIQTFTVDPVNELTNVTSTGTFTVSGNTPARMTTVTVNGQTAQTYENFTFARTNLTLINGQNTFTNVVQNPYSVWATNMLVVNLPVTNALSFDLNGNLTNDGTKSFFYDAENQLVTNLVVGQWKSEFVYDGLNRRRIARDYSWDGVKWVKTNEVRYICDGMLPIQERDANNNVLVTYTRGLDLSGSLQGAGGIGGLMARTDANGSTFYHADGNGNITGLIDGYQNMVARYLYNPFGKPVGQWGSLADANVMRFSSKPVHRLSGDYDLGLRWYTPIWQGFLTSDPIGEAGGIPLHGFVGNSPLDFVDAYGLRADLGSGSVAEDFGRQMTTINNSSGVPHIIDGGDTLVNPPEKLYANYELSGDDRYLDNLTQLAGNYPDPASAMYFAQKGVDDPNGQFVLLMAMGGLGDMGRGKEPCPTAGAKLHDLPGKESGWTKMKGNQGWKDADGNFWKKDQLHKDHWDVSDRKGNKIREVDFNGNQIWPGGPKNKNK